MHRTAFGAHLPWRAVPGVQVSTPAGRLLQREFESTDRAIDALVYELSPKGMIYGLTEAEIKIVEGG